MVRSFLNAVFLISFRSQFETIQYDLETTEELMNKLNATNLYVL